MMNELTFVCPDVIKEKLHRKMKIEFCIASSRGHSAGHLDTKIRGLPQFLSYCKFRHLKHVL